MYLLFICFLGETIVRNNSVDQAVDYRDGMAKVCEITFTLWVFDYKQFMFCTFYTGVWEGRVTLLYELYGHMPPQLGYGCCYFGLGSA